MNGNQKSTINITLESEEQGIDSLTGQVLSEPLVSSNSLTLANTSDTRTLSIEEELRGFPGGKVTVPVFINDTDKVQSLTLTLNYDTDVFDVIDPVEDTETNEAIRRTGISDNWKLTAEEGDNPDAELANPAAMVDDEAGEIKISLFNSTDEVTPAGSDNIVEIDLTIAADAPIDSTGSIDLRSARLGIDGETEETVLGDSLLGDGTVTVVAGGSIDIDGNGVADALTDGVLMVRHLFGFTGNSLIDGAVSPNATRTTADEIQTYISQIESNIDIDGNGVADALTDGVLMVRHLFGFTGNSLIDGAVSPDSTRTTADEITSAINDLIP